MDEKKLKKARLLAMSFSIIGPVCFIGVGLVCIFLFANQMLLTAVILVAMIVLLFLYSAFVIQPLTNQYKKAIMKEVLQDIFTISSFDFKSSLKEEYLKINGLVFLEEKDYTDTYNYIQCQLENSDFHLADLQIINGNATKKNKQNRIKNSGIWSVMQTPQHTYYPYHILSKNKDNITLIKKLEKDPNYKKIMAKSEKINSSFFLFTTKENKEKYFPENYANAILRLKETSRGYSNLYINENKIHLCIFNQEEVFEPSLKKNLSKGEIDALRKKYKAVLAFINALKNENV